VSYQLSYLHPFHRGAATRSHFVSATIRATPDIPGIPDGVAAAGPAIGWAGGADDPGSWWQLGLATWATAGDDETAAAEIRAAVSAFFVIGELGQDDPPVYGRLGQVRAPAVVVRGDREYPMVADCADAIASRIPGCGRIIIPGADHLLPLRAPARLAEMLTEQAA
jgi:pimeloyl-ACP methyl ester carboxylesterase